MTGRATSGPLIGAITVAKATVVLCVGLVAVAAEACIEEPEEERAAAYMELGRIQYTQSEFRDAQVSFGKAVEEIERTHDASTVELVEPLIALGNAQMAIGRFDQASQSFGRAASIVRRDGGVNDPRQQVPLERMAEAQALAGDLTGALGSLKYLERVSEATYGARSEAHGVALSGIGERLCEYGSFFDGRSRHRDAVDVLSAAAAGTAEQIDALRAVARCNLHELAFLGIATRVMPPTRATQMAARPQGLDADSTSFRLRVTRLMRRESELALVQAAQLALTSPTMQPDEKIEVLLEAGDWFQMKDHVRTARTYYQQVLQLPGGQRHLTQPVMLLYATPPMALQNPSAVDASQKARSVLVEFEVGSDGRAQSEHVLDRNATKSMVDEALSAIRAARFRPRFADGKPQNTVAVTYRQSFIP